MRIRVHCSWRAVGSRRSASRITLLQCNFADLPALELEAVNAIVFDLGLSSMQLASSGRGFSFRQDEPLDMRFDTDGNRPTAAELVNTLGEAELERILSDYGEEPRARRVAREWCAGGRCSAPASWWRR